MKKRTLAVTVGTLALVMACGGTEEAPPAEGAADSAAPPSAAAPAPATEAFLNPDVATREELMTVPGVDAALADALIAGRPYTDMTKVDAVIGNKLTDEQKDVFYARVWKPLDLNSATEAEILLIPG